MYNNNKIVHGLNFCLIQFSLTLKSRRLFVVTRNVSIKPFRRRTQNGGDETNKIRQFDDALTK